jgi:hypothetical protein
VLESNLDQALVDRICVNVDTSRLVNLLVKMHSPHDGTSPTSDAVGLCVKPCACPACAFEVGKTMYVLAYTLSLKQPSLRFIRAPSLAVVADVGSGSSAPTFLTMRDSQHRIVLSQAQHEALSVYASVTDSIEIFRNKKLEKVRRIVC